MAKSQKVSEHFLIEGRGITLFGLQGVPMGANWGVGINLGSAKKPSYVLTTVDPAPALQDVLDVIVQDRENGNLGKIALVVMSSRVAVRLFLEGALKAGDFDDATESELNTRLFLEGGVIYPAIKLKKVQFGDDAVLPVAIMSEMQIGPGTIVTIDDNGRIV